MRFGKKLAIMMDASSSHSSLRPFISHKSLKDLLSNVVRGSKTGLEISLLTSKIYEFKSTMMADISLISTRISEERGELDNEVRSLKEDGFLLGVVESSAAVSLISAIQNVCPERYLKIRSI